MPSPYRSPESLARPRVRFGDPRRGALSIALGLALIGVSVATVLAWTHLGGRIFGSVLLPAVLGVYLLLRARWGSLELARQQGLLLVERRGVWPRRLEHVALGDVQSVDTVAASFRDDSPDYDLDLVLAGDRRLRLRRAGTQEALERDRAAIADFLREHALLWGAGAGGGAAFASRVAPPETPPSAEEEDESPAGEGDRGEKRGG